MSPRWLPPSVAEACHHSLPVLLTLLTLLPAEPVGPEEDGANLTPVRPRRRRPARRLRQPACWTREHWLAAGPAALARTIPRSRRRTARSGGWVSVRSLARHRRCDHRTARSCAGNSSAHIRPGAAKPAR